MYDRNGTITIGNSAQIGDGAAALIIGSESCVVENKLSPLARVIGYSQSSVDPMDFCKADCLSIQRVLDNCKMGLN